MNAASSSIVAIHLQPVGEGIALEVLDELAAALARTFRVSCHVRSATLDVRFALDAIRGARRPLIVAGGGVLMSEASEALAAFAAFVKKKYSVDLKTSTMPQGTPVAYGQIVEWKGKPQADVFWGGEGTLFDLLAEQNLLDKITIPKAMWDEIPATIGKPVGLPLKDPKGFWVGTMLEPYGLIYQPKLLKRLGV